MQADNTTYAHEYVIKDHLGNTRVTYRDDNTTASPLDTIKVEEITQVNHFFPFGLNMEGNWNGSFPEAKNKYQFGGKELNSDFGLEWNDFGARFYDPAVSRWTTVDPLAEKMPRHSPYNYAFDNPMRFVDPDGMQGEDWVRGKKGAYFDPKITSRGDAIANGVEYLGKELLTTDPKTNAGYFGNDCGEIQCWGQMGAEVKITPKWNKQDSDYSPYNAPLETVGAVTETTGDIIKYTGFFVTPFAPEFGIPIAESGELISNIGVGMQITASLIKGDIKEAGKKAIIEGLPAVGESAVKRLIPKGMEAASKLQLENHIKMQSETSEKLIEKLIDKNSTPKKQ